MRPLSIGSKPAVGYAPGSGDYNADGVSSSTIGLDYPNAASYHQGNNRTAFLNGVFTPATIRRSHFRFGGQ